MTKQTAFQNLNLARTRSGISFDRSYNFWQIFDPAGTARIDFDRLRPLVSDELLEAAKGLVAHYLSTRSTSLSQLVFERFCGFCRFASENKALTAVQAADILAY